MGKKTVPGVGDSPGSGLGGGSLGLLLGVCTLQILMKPAMSMMRAMPISRTAHQWACKRGEEAAFN